MLIKDNKFYVDVDIVTEKGKEDDDEEVLTKKTLVQDIDKYLNNKLTTGIDNTCICTRKGLLGKLSSLFKEYNIDIKPCNKKKTSEWSKNVTRPWI